MCLSYLKINSCSHSRRDEIADIIHKNIDILNEIAVTKNYKLGNEIDGVEDVTFKYLGREDFFIDFYCRGIGIVPSGIYFGFYYISTDEPLGFQGDRVTFEKDGDGLRWQQKNGDNYYYIEKILDHWYYYEAGF